MRRPAWDEILSHIKFMLSGVYEWAIATGALPLNANPIRSAVKGQGAGKPLSLDSLNTRVIAPALKKAGLDWRGGYYPSQRGISSLVTDTSKNALNSTGLLRHSTPITALKHYTTADEQSVDIAMKDVEARALKLIAKSETVR